MGRPDTTAKLRELRAAAERISATLVDLELDPGRQTLDGSVLAGKTAERWAGARTALTELWRRQGLLETLLGRAEHARGQQLAELLFGSSIELAGADVPITQRALLAGDRSGERCSPDELLSSMSALFEAVKDALGAITHAWEPLLPKLDEARRRLALARTLADDVGALDRSGLDAAEADVRRLGESVSSDPLSVASAQVDERLDALAALVTELERDAEVKHGLDLRAGAARQLLARIDEAVDDAEQALENLKQKIAKPVVPEIPGAPDDLAAELDDILATARTGEWRTARTQLERWNAAADARLKDAERAAAASRAPIATRNEFRALLDAYAVKARRIGLSEEPDIAAIFDAARDELYTAPTDIARAAELVRSYQHALAGITATTEARP